MVTILVIDDQDSFRRLLRTVLERAGHEVMEAPNGRLGLAVYRERPPDLVITDMLMPEMNGLDMILELTRAFLNVKVIAISVARYTECLRRGKAPGSPAHLTQTILHGSVVKDRAV